MGLQLLGCWILQRAEQAEQAAKWPKLLQSLTAVRGCLEESAVRMFGKLCWGCLEKSLLRVLKEVFV